jgi:hypothetical protein
MKYYQLMEQYGKKKNKKKDVPTTTMQHVRSIQTTLPNNRVNLSKHSSRLR